MRRVFITGIEGFVGTRLARHLADAGFAVAGFYFVKPASNIDFATVAYCDIRDAAEVQRQLAAARPDLVIHLAAISSVVVAEHNLAEAFHINVRGTLNLLEAIRQLPAPARTLLVSSAEIYDREAGNGTKSDESAPLKPMNNYALTKLSAEQFAHYYSDRYGLDVVILRPFSHTGPGQSTNFVFPSVARQIAEAELGTRPPEIQVGNTDVSRDYTDVRDICRAYELALTVERGTYNLTSEQILRIGAGIEYLVSLARVPIKMTVAAERKRQESALLAGSSAKFRAATGWQPQYDIHQTLRDVLEHERHALRVTRDASGTETDSSPAHNA